MKKKYIILNVLAMISTNIALIAIDADISDISLTQDPESTVQHEKAIDPLDEPDFDEFAEFDLIINEMQPEDFPQREKPSWAMRKLIGVSAALYMKCRALNKWFNQWWA